MIPASIFLLLILIILLNVSAEARVRARFKEQEKMINETRTAYNDLQSKLKKLKII